VHELLLVQGRQVVPGVDGFFVGGHGRLSFF
jgi:hypothetical protein